METPLMPVNNTHAAPLPLRDVPTCLVFSADLAGLAVCSHVDSAGRRCPDLSDGIMAVSPLVNVRSRRRTLLAF